MASDAGSISITGASFGGGGGGGGGDGVCGGVTDAGGAGPGLLPPPPEQAVIDKAAASAINENLITILRRQELCYYLSITDVFDCELSRYIKMPILGQLKVRFAGGRNSQCGLHRG